MSIDCATCTRDDSGTEYCMDYLVRAQITVSDVCGPCLARLIPQVDMAAGRNLPWPVWLRQRADVPDPALLEPIRDAGVAP